MPGGSQLNRIKISHGRIIDPANRIDRTGTLFIAEGKILAIDNEPDGFQADHVIDAENLIVCPGFIDLSARLREPGHTRKATITSETSAALSAGITTLCIPPDTWPVIDTPAIAELIKEKSEQADYPSIYPIAALTHGLQGNELSSMHALKRANCIAVSNAQKPVANLLILRRAMEYAASHDLLLIYHPEDHWLRNNGCAHEGAFATRFGLPGIPETAETIALAQCLELVKQTGCRVHFARLSCARSVELMQQAKNMNLPVSADVAMHQLHLTEDDMKPFDSHYHVIPPLRTVQDKLALREAVKAGILDVICSDHQPHDIDAKLGAFPETEPGISSLETLIPLMLKLVNDKILNLQQGILSLTGKPAAILDLDAGMLKPGSPADLCIFDPEATWTIDHKTWKSRGQNTPYWGHTMQGRVIHTIQTGRIVYNQELET